MSILSFKLDDLRNINWKDFFKRLYTKALDEEEILGIAAQVAFYFAFALFPLLLFLISIFGFDIGFRRRFKTGDVLLSAAGDDRFGV